MSITVTQAPSIMPDMNTIMTGAGVTPKTILADRILSSDPTYSSMTEADKTKKKNTLIADLKDDSPAIIAIKQEILAANALIKTVGNNIPLLVTPFTAPGAGMAIASVLGDLLEMLNNLGLLDKLPDAFKAALLTISTSITAVNTIISTVNGALMAIGVCLVNEKEEKTGIIPEVPVPTITIA